MIAYPPHEFVLQEDWREFSGVPVCQECSRPEWDATHSDYLKQQLQRNAQTPLGLGAA
jgi:hypothetical protein